MLFNAGLKTIVFKIMIYFVIHVKRVFILFEYTKKANEPMHII